MSELIEKRDAYNILKDMICFVRRDVLLNAYDTLKNLPTVKPASPWHRVEVEEPSKAGWYLVMDVDGDFNVDEWHNTFGWHFVTPSDADRITHWMPIEPPKEDA